MLCHVYVRLYYQDETMIPDNNDFDDIMISSLGIGIAAWRNITYWTDYQYCIRFLIYRLRDSNQNHTSTRTFCHVEEIIRILECFGLNALILS